MLNRRHRDRLKEFRNPQEAVPDYSGGRGGDQPEGFDPSSHTIEQILDHLGISDGHDPVTAEEFERVREAEKAGKNRPTLLTKLDEYEASTQEPEVFDPGEHEIDEVRAYLDGLDDTDPEARDAEFVRVVEAEREGQNRPELLEFIGGTPDSE